MMVFGFPKSWRRAVLAAVAGLSVLPAAAQENNEAAQPDDRGVNPAAEKVVKADSIAFYQIRAGETDYTPGRLRVVDPRRGELRGVSKTGLLLIRDGQIVGRAETGVGGVAQLRHLAAGPYSVIAIGPDGMAAFGMEVLPPTTGVAVPTYRFDALMVPAADMAVAQSLLAAPPAPVAAPPAAAVPGTIPPPNPPLPATPASFKRRQKGATVVAAPVEGAVAAQADADGAAAPCKGDIVVVRSGDRMVGQLLAMSSDPPSAMGNARLLFLRDGRLLGTIETNSEGYFGATGIEDGTYSMVGVGPNGFIALGVQVTTAAGPATADAGGRAIPVTYVSALKQDGIPTTNLRAVGAGSDALPFAPGFAGPGPFGPGPLGAGGPFPGGGGGGFGGGAGGGAAGGGGGLGGGGLLGALLGAGLGAGIGAAVAGNNDDNGNGNNAQATPNGPPFNPTPGVPGPPFTPPGPPPGVPGNGNNP